MNNANNLKPTVHIYEANANPAHLSEICAGLEEEGILCAIFNANGNAKTLAYEAANNSRLRVGIGITSDAAALQIRNCVIDKPVFLVSLSEDTGLRKKDHNAWAVIMLDVNTCRNLGINAARAVKGGAFV